MAINELLTIFILYGSFQEVNCLC
jgi:hypothetical protein